MGLLRRRPVTVLAAAVGIVLVVAGAVIAYLGYERTGGPGHAVRSYFRALADGDAPRALAWGTVPDGPHTLLTSTVLAEQQRIAPIRHVTVRSITRAGSRATVHVSYDLEFPGHEFPVAGAVQVADGDDGWRLASAAVPTQLVLASAGQRARVLTGPIPTGTVLLFPGAAPISFDSPYLQLDPDRAVVGFGAEPETDVSVQVSPAGRTAVGKAVDAKLAACFRSTGHVACPLPDDSYVPGSLRGRITHPDYTITLDSDPAGLIDVTAKVPFDGTYRRLDFVDRAAAGTGALTLDVHAQTYAAKPLDVTWASS